MYSQRIIILVVTLSAVLLPAQGRPANDYEYFDNEINPISELSTPKAMLPSSTFATKSMNPVLQSAPEVTTEYKYKDIIEPYTMEVPRVESIRHVAGTLYYTVDPKEDPYEKLMQVYEQNFEIPMNRNLPKHKPPPKD